MTGQVLGALDITGGDVVAHPHSLALVLAAARVAETRLPGPGSGPARLWRPGTRPPPRLEALGRGEGVLRLDGQDIRLNRRHSEIVFLLAAHPEGMTGAQLAAALYDNFASQTTLRVEMTRLRRIVGDLLRSRPYRLTSLVTADYLDVSAALRRGDVTAAVSAYAGPLLPSSEAPGVAAERDWLDTQLRSAVIASGDPQLLQAWSERFRVR